MSFGSVPLNQAETFCYSRNYLNVLNSCGGSAGSGCEGIFRLFVCRSAMAYRCSMLNFSFVCGDLTDHNWYLLLVSARTSSPTHLASDHSCHASPFSDSFDRGLISYCYRRIGMAWLCLVAFDWVSLCCRAYLHLPHFLAICEVLDTRRRLVPRAPCRPVSAPFRLSCWSCLIQS